MREKAEKVRQAQAEKQQASATTATLQAALNTKARWANWGTKKSAAAQPLAPTASAGEQHPHKIMSIELYRS